MAALALRPQVLVAGPLIPAVRRDLGLSHTAAGLLGTIPVLCMGLFALPASRFSRAVGSRAALAIAVFGIAGFGIARAGAPTGIVLLLLTVPVSIGMGLGNALLPVAAKEHFHDRPAFATGIYATGINVGAAATGFAAAPIAHAVGGWRGALVVISIAAAVSGAAWVALTRGAHGESAPAEPHVRLPFGNRLVWRLIAIFALQSTTYYGLNAWLPAVYVERGWSETAAGGLLGVLNLVAIPAGMLVAAIADRIPRRGYLMLGALMFIAATLGVELLPSGAWAWAALAGIGSGTLFPLVMTLPLDVAKRPAQVSAVVGAMLGAGYALSALSPLALGAVRDGTGSFGDALWVLVASSCALVVLFASLSRARLDSL
ncbi:MAG: transporter, family, cyanate transporter [Gaiellaceae bacterium]|jgi:CP family cyanate transporter-like MFS transporter|nr:transporter, family, cyanate transporter [Gaiellaceae bacterium]